jgi:hypothetical protein
MAKEKVSKEEDSTKKIPSIHDIEWTDYVLGLLSDDEKIAGNPTTDGLRRIFEVALNCTLVRAESSVEQAPALDNERRATVVHSLTYIINDGGVDDGSKFRTVSGAADVYWGNCDKIYRNHPVAVAETRAEGRALRRALKLRKVVAAEELSKEVADHPDNNSEQNISSNQINFIDVMAKRLNINVLSLVSQLGIDATNVDKISHDNAVLIIKELSKHQQDINSIPSDILTYQPNWQRKE